MNRLLVLFVALGGGCGLFGNNSTSSTTGGTTGSTSFGTPTLEVTVNGVHSGPATPDGNSFVDMINEYENGSLSRSSLQIFASSTAADASCSLAVDRFGQFVTGFGVGTWTLSAEGANGTAGGTAEPQGAPSAATRQGVFSCTGSDCDGVGLTLSWIDAGHAEGFFSGTLSGASVLCSFYLPTRTFQP
jgi:hypothetical protein